MLLTGCGPLTRVPSDTQLYRPLWRSTYKTHKESVEKFRKTWTELSDFVARNGKTRAHHKALNLWTCLCWSPPTPCCKYSGRKGRLDCFRLPRGWFRSFRHKGKGFHLKFCAQLLGEKAVGGGGVCRNGLNQLWTLEGIDKEKKINRKEFLLKLAIFSRVAVARQ